MEIIAAQNLISAGLDGIVNEIIKQVNYSEIVVNPEADFNRSTTYRPYFFVKAETGLEQIEARQTPFDISFPSADHNIDIVGQSVMASNPFFAGTGSDLIFVPGLTTPGTPGPANEREFAIKQIKILKQIDWKRIAEIEENIKKPTGKIEPFNREAVVKILLDLGFKAGGGAKAMSKKALIAKLIEYNKAYALIIKNNPGLLEAVENNDLSRISYIQPIVVEPDDQDDDE